MEFHFLHFTWEILNNCNFKFIQFCRRGQLQAVRHSELVRDSVFRKLDDIGNTGISGY